MEKDLKFVALLDCYGQLLTETQRDMAELYYCEDLSLTEIAESRGITRQAVHLIIKQAEGKFKRAESKLGLVEKFSQLYSITENLRQIAENIEDSELSAELLQQINQLAEL